MDSKDSIGLALRKAAQASHSANIGVMGSNIVLASIVKHQVVDLFSGWISFGNREAFDKIVQSTLEMVAAKNLSARRCTSQIM